MQSLWRTLSSRACSTSGRLVSTRAFSNVAEEAVVDEAAKQKGPKSILHRLLSSSESPLTAADMWAAAEGEGLKSKRFMKQMLVQMRKRGHVKTVPLGAGKKHKAFGYQLSRASEAAEAAGGGAAPENGTQGTALNP